MFRKTAAVSTLCSRLCLGLLLVLGQQAARADVWGWVDDVGTAHFAPQRVDARYQLYFRAGENFDSRDMGGNPVPSYPAPPSAERMRTFFDVSPDYKAVRPYLRDASRALALDYELLQALILTESGFNAGAVSPKGAVGLMQVMPTTALRYGLAGDAKNPVARKLADPSTNIRTGTRYLRYLLDLFPGQVELALAAYNAGEGAVQRAGNRIPDYPETQNYVKTVMQVYQMLKPGARGRSLAGGPPLRVRMEMPAGDAADDTSSPVPVPGRIANRGNLPSGLAQAAADLSDDLSGIPR
jgi:hypothetical protein